MDGAIAGVLVASLLNGLRHGVDVDHLAAISDFSGAQTNPKRSLVLSTAYASGHALILIALGAAAVLLGARIPTGLDVFMGRLIGVTLVALGTYVVVSVLRNGRDFRMRSRWSLIGDFVKASRETLNPRRTETVVIEHQHDHDTTGHHEYVSGLSEPTSTSSVAVATRTHTHIHTHVGTMPIDPLPPVGTTTAFGIGMLHGVGAETPTQLLLFVTAAGVGSNVIGLALVLVFVAGLFIMNTAVAIASTFGFAGGRRLPTLYMTVALVTGIFSLLVGSAYALGRADVVARLIGF
jgi:high-affinity nickel-transport protein